MMSVATIVAEAWDRTLRETPDPFDFSDWLEHRTYRERLDRQRRNGAGDLIPRIATVRRNLRLLGNIRLDPARLST